jgi:hypothetical protein
MALPSDAGAKARKQFAQARSKAPAKKRSTSMLTNGPGRSPAPKRRYTPPPPEVAKRAPKPAPPRRGHAPNVFTEPVLRNPIEKIQTKQRRSTARALQNAAHAERGGADPGAIPAAPRRPLTNREVNQILRSAPAHSVVATLPAEPKKHKGGGFKLTPTALVHLPSSVLGDIPKELKGSGAVEGVLTRLGVTSAKGWEQVPGVGKFLGRASKDAYGIAATAVPSVYLPARAVATGHPGKGLHMITDPIIQTAKHPIKSFNEHPVGTLLILRGGEGALSRGLGATARAGVLGKTVREAAGTKRVPLHLAGNAIQQRHASLGLIENAAQKAVDRRAIKKGRGTTTKVPVYDADGKLLYNAKVKTIKATPRQLTSKNSVRPSIPLAGKLNRRVDLEYNKGVDIGRQRRDVAIKYMGKQKPKHADAVALVNEGIIKTGNEHRPLTPETVHADLMQHLEQLRAEGEHLTLPDEKAMNAENIRQVERLLKDHAFLADPRHVIEAAQKYAGVHATHEAARVHHGDIALDQAERRVLLPFAHRELGLEYDYEARHFVTAEGDPIPTETILREFEQRGGNLHDLAYVPQIPGFRGARNFHGSYHQRPPVEYRRFTGAANRAGLYERNYDVLTEQLAKSSTRTARHESVTNLVNNFGIKQHNGDWFNYDTAMRESRTLAEATGEHYVPFTAARPKAPQTLVEDMEPATAEMGWREANPGDKHVVLLPKAVADRLMEHDAVAATRVTGRAAVVTLSRYFRHAVLPTSSKWLVGDVLEQYLRMQVHELTPVQVATTIRAGRRLEARLGREFGQQHVENLRAAAGSGLFGSQRNIDIFNPNEGAYMGFIHAFRRSGFGPGKAIGPNGVANLWERYRDLVFSANRTLTEGSAYYYALGKEARRDVSEMVSLWDRALGHAGPAYADVVRGLTQSNNVARYAKAVDDIRGRYSNLSPTGRYFVSTYTPFAPWYANAVYFIGALPVKHPVKTGILAAAHEGTEQERANSGVPPWAKTSVPLAGGRYIPLEHYTPFGILEGDTPLANAAGLVLPQESGIGMNARGLTWYGQKLPDGTNPNLVALNTAFETFVPLVARARAVEKGNSAAPDSTIFHPKTKTQGGSYLAGLRKAVDPGRAQGGTGGPAKAPKGVAGGGNRFLQAPAAGPAEPTTKNRFLSGG